MVPAFLQSDCFFSRPARRAYISVRPNILLAGQRTNEKSDSIGHPMEMRSSRESRGDGKKKVLEEHQCAEREKERERERERKWEKVWERMVQVVRAIIFTGEREWYESVSDRCWKESRQWMDRSSHYETSASFQIPYRVYDDLINETAMFPRLGISPSKIINAIARYTTFAERKKKKKKKKREEKKIKKEKKSLHSECTKSRNFFNWINFEFEIPRKLNS